QAKNIPFYREILTGFCFFSLNLCESPSGHKNRQEARPPVCRNESAYFARKEKLAMSSMISFTMPLASTVHSVPSSLMYQTLPS
ncbi:MAG: hypothetical protein IJ175_09905, partial [Clostridia bacterium]|nr:hypothetical protein [Clostridia bacterium]